MTLSSNPKVLLIHGLVGDRIELYNTNAYFKQSVDQLASALPLWVDGIAADAEKSGKHMTDLKWVMQTEGRPSAEAIQAILSEKDERRD